ncbi:Fic family protein, partial [Clostridiaceae bacterium HSG29]|nr:Fic family protein [Clostridiaceae bacterium HSG29]
MNEDYGNSTTNSIYCYPDSTVLKNKLNIEDHDELKKVEKELTFMKIDALYESPITGTFDITHLKKIHKYLFNDIYDFAGKLRMEDIEKIEPVYTKFLNHNDIKNHLILLFKDLKEENYLIAYSKDEFIKRSSYYLGELNYIHPFREGNGRVIREFYRNLALFNGYKINWWFISKDNLINSFVNATFKEY